MNILQWLFLPAALLLGFIFLVIFVLLVTSYSNESTKEEKLKEMRSDHYMRSTAETNRLIEMQHEARVTGDWSTHDNYKKLYDEQWNERVKKIVEIECPISDETWEELEAGINPYK